LALFVPPSDIGSNERHRYQDRDYYQEDDDGLAHAPIHACSPHETLSCDFPIVTVLKFLFVNNINSPISQTWPFLADQQQIEKSNML
jgi:hypothetical protein